MRCRLPAVFKILRKELVREKAVSTIWSIILIPVWVLMLLIVLDLGRIMAAESVIESALDAGALAGAFQVDGKYFKSSGGEIKFTQHYSEFVKDYFDRSMSAIYGAKADVLVTQIKDDKVQARIEIKVPLLFGKIVGRDQVSFVREVTSSAHRVKLDDYLPVDPSLGS
jgi:hypothetical protein